MNISETEFITEQGKSRLEKDKSGRCILNMEETNGEYSAGNLPEPIKTFCVQCGAFNRKEHAQELKALLIYNQI